MTATKGNISFPSTEGLSGDRSSGPRIVQRGTVDYINKALLNLQYLGPKNYFGTDSLTIDIDDGVANHVATLHIEIEAVNDAPSVHSPTSILKTEENVEIAVYQVFGVVFSDVDAAVGESYRVNLTTSNGSLTFGRHIENLKFMKGDGYSMTLSWLLVYFLTLTWH